MKNLKDQNFSGYVAFKNGEIYSLKTNRYLSGWIEVGGYRAYALTDDSGKVNQVKGHRVIAEAFLTNPDPLVFTQVNHKDGDKVNNHVTNLEWCTPQMNSQHSIENKLRPPTFYHEDTKLPSEDDVRHDWTKPLSYLDVTEEDVHQACELMQQGYRVCDVSAMLVMDRRFIQSLRDNQKAAFVHITSKYDFSKLRRKNKTSPETVLEICRLLQDTDLSFNKIAEKTGTNRKTVSNIKHRVSYTDISHGFQW